MNIKHLIIITFSFIPYIAIAADPPTSCPSGYIEFTEEYITITDTVCLARYIPAGTADNSCLINTSSGLCIMYAPANITYSDITGEYEFTSACPLE